MTTDQILHNFRVELAKLVPDFVKELLLTRDEATMEHHQLLICNAIKETCSFRTDSLSIFKWLDLDEDFFTIEKINFADSYDNFFRAFKNKGGGLIILTKLLDILEDIDIELAVTYKS